MRAGQPAGAVQLEIVEMNLTDELRVRRAAAANPRADVENDETVAPIAHVQQTVLRIDIVEIPSADLVASFRYFDCARERLVHLPSRDFPRIVHLGEVDNAQRAGGIVSQVDIVSVDK